MPFEEKLLSRFQEYISKYDMANDKILNKYYHSIRVMELSIKFSKLLGFNDENVAIASVVALLHDIGRFEQINSGGAIEDEAAYTIKLLFEDGLIRNFADNEEWYPIIRYAIENHNKKTICLDGATDIMIEHAKLIRDCDKLDIISGHAVSPHKVREADDSEISDAIRDKFYRKEQLDKKELKTNNERLLIKFSIAFDINNDIFLPYLKEAYEKYYKRIEYENRFKDFYEAVIAYIDERLQVKKQ